MIVYAKSNIGNFIFELVGDFADISAAIAYLCKYANDVGPYIEVRHLYMLAIMQVPTSIAGSKRVKGEIVVVPTLESYSEFNYLNLTQIVFFGEPDNNAKTKHKQRWEAHKKETQEKNMNLLSGKGKLERPTQ